LLVQVETAAALRAIEEIAAVEGVDGIFIGPSDLAADMGFLGRPAEPAVRVAVEDGIRRITAAQKPAGILTSDQTLARRYIDLGARFVAVGTDVTLLSQATSALLAKYKMAAPLKPPGPPSGY
jgi:4-hydroxy-2-oxoheptanedioate aldolase